jgi:hypothetical protein
MRPEGRERERLLMLRECARATYWQWRDEEDEGYQPTAYQWELLESSILHLNMKIFGGL